MRYINIVLICFCVAKVSAQTAIVSDESYSWWCEPISYYHPGNGYNYYTSIVAESGRHKISRYKQGVGLDSLALYSAFSPDEHNTPAFLINQLSDSILVVWSGRNSNHFFAETLTIDLQEVDGPRSIINEIGFGSSTAYSQLLQLSGKVFLLSRTGLYNWHITWSSNFGRTWATGVKLFEKSVGDIPGQLYINPVIDGDWVHFAQYHHPDNSGAENEMKVWRLNALTGYIYHASTELGNIFTGAGLPVHVNNEGTPILEAPADSIFRLLDIANYRGSLVIAYADYLTADKDRGMYRIMYVNPETATVDSTHNIIAHGGRTYLSYVGGVYFQIGYTYEWNRAIMLGRESSGTWYIERYKMLNTGAWIRSHTYETLDETAAGLSLTRPLPPVGSATGNGWKCMWQNGDYDETFTTWDNILKVKF